MEQDTFDRLTELTKKVQNAIFNNPEIAMGVSGWKRRDGKHGPTQFTNQRPDGSSTKRHDKMSIFFREKGYLYLSYNGSSYRSGAIWSFLKERYHEEDFIRLLRILCEEYYIPFNLDGRIGTCSNMMQRARARERTMTTKAIHSPTHMKKETDVHYLPKDLVAPYIDYTRYDQLRAYLNRFLDPMTLECVWIDYGVGIAKDGRPIFFYYDKTGQCRDGKIIRFTEDGHRDRKTACSILAIPSLLQKSGYLPSKVSYGGILYGEHLLTRYPDKKIAVVESEKTALIASAVCPEYIFVATGGISNNLDRVVTLLSGRGVRIFPDADAFDVWSKRFTRGGGFIVSDLTKRLASERGQAWKKCDLADFIIDQRIKIKESDEISCVDLEE